MKTDFSIANNVFEQGDRQNLIASVKEHIKNGRERLRAKHLNGVTGEKIVKKYTLLIDEIIKGLYSRFKNDSSTLLSASHQEQCVLIALGGYGREELNPYSDIDLMLLYPSKLTPFIKKLNESMLYIMWDLGLDMGYSLRSVKECIQLANDDLKTKTSVLDSRYLIGNKEIFKDFIVTYNRKVVCKNEMGFINDKLHESMLRHEKYGGSVYILEPNIKEGEGGLRDLHTILWIAKVKRGIENINDLSKQGICSTEEMNLLKKAQEFLWRIRNDLHFSAKRKADQLNFEAQERIAELFGFKNTKKILGVEDFMRQYYIHANNISHNSSLINSRLLRGANEKSFIKRLINEKKIDNDFNIFNGKIHVMNESVFKNKPEKMFIAFEYFQKFGVDFDTLTEELIFKNLSLVENVRESPEVRDTFLRILNYKERIFQTLEKMHSLRFLGKYIPEFEGITCRVQHDVYHIYTIDTHSLFAVKELEYLRKKEAKNEFSFLSQLICEIKRFDLLVLAVLFHDIGKGKGAGHSSIGADLVCTTMERMGFSKDDTQTVSFLVKKHLLLANIAQHRDIHDIKLITDFARTIGSIVSLNMLYLLTFADVRAVGPSVWTHWKGTMFYELYMRVNNILEKGTFELEGTRDRLNVIRKELYKISDGELDKDMIRRHFKRFPARYFLSNPPENLIMHIKILSQLKDKGFIIETEHIAEKGYTAVVVCTHDTPGLFSKFAGVMASNNVNIIKAQINTSRDGVALDVFYVNNPIGGLITEKTKWDRIQKDFKDVLEGTVRVDRLVKKRKISMLDRKFKPKVSTRIGIDNIVSDDFTVIDIHAQDRVGHLYMVTNALSDLGLYICISKISTNGDEAVDVFYVRDIFGHKIADEGKMKKIEDTLYKVLGEETVAT